MNISLAFTTYKSEQYIRNQLDKDFFSQSDGWINEIVIRDDCSDDYDKLKKFESDNIKIFKNDSNIGPLLSRPKLVENCKNDWILLMDSDNYLNRQCFDVLKNIELKDDTIYCPCFAMPRFNFPMVTGKTLTLSDIKPLFPALEVQIFLNTGNYLIPKKQYLEISKQIDTSYAHFTVDVIYFNYLWLSSGRKLSCVKGFEYDHTLRGDSYYMTHSGRSGKKLEEVNEKYLRS